jgi:glucose/arabinose dehydrogenase
VEQRDPSRNGHVRVFDLNTNTLLPKPFLTIPSVAGGSEQGLLGLAFHPDYASNGFFYVHYNRSSGATIVDRFQVSGDPNVADPASRHPVFTTGQPFSNHNGGWLAYGPDGYLYLALGDGGSGGDPGNRGQNTGVFLGKMLRIDPDGDDFPADPNRNYAIPPTNPFAGGGGLGEIWAYGLRNPWRDSFDRATGDLWIADVGQGAWEEIDFQPGTSTGGENYGWRCYEGDHAFNLGGCAPANTMVFPIHEYSHALGCSVTGGYVYRGCAVPDLDGTYFFADFCSARIWSFRYDGVMVSEFTDRTAELAPGGGLSIRGISSFGEDAAGEIYICDLSGGEVFKIVPDGVPPVPCPCAANCPGDVNGDDRTDLTDLGILLNNWGCSNCTCAQGDLTGEGNVDLNDLSIMLNDWGCVFP